MPLHRRDGTYFGTLCALDPLPHELSDDDVAIFELLSGLIAYEMESEERRLRQEAAVRNLEDFVAVASHDLRQPLTIMYGWAQLLVSRVKRGDSTQNLTEIAETMLLSARDAILLSDALLDTASIDTGSFTLDTGPTDLVGIVDGAVSELRVIASEHEFVVESPSELVIQADESRLGRVIRNLLDNAVKYAPAESGPITVQLAEITCSGEARVSISVCDCGGGVNDDELGHLFDRQYRAPAASSLGVRGTGLGLYVVRQIVEAHGGTVWAEHGQPSGLCVRLTLPRF